MACYHLQGLGEVPCAIPNVHAGTTKQIEIRIGILRTKLKETNLTSLLLNSPEEFVK